MSFVSMLHRKEIDGKSPWKMYTFYRCPVLVFEACYSPFYVQPKNRRYYGP